MVWTHVSYATSATKDRKQSTTSLQYARSPVRCGTMSCKHSGSKFHQSPKRRSPGGVDCGQCTTTISETAWTPSSPWSPGNYGRNGTQDVSESRHRSSATYCTSSRPKPTTGFRPEQVGSARWRRARMSSR